MTCLSIHGDEKFTGAPLYNPRHILGHPTPQSRSPHPPSHLSQQPFQNPKNDDGPVAPPATEPVSEPKANTGPVKPPLKLSTIPEGPTQGAEPPNRPKEDETRRSSRSVSPNESRGDRWQNWNNWGWGFNDWHGPYNGRRRPFWADLPVDTPRVDTAFAAPEPPRNLITEPDKKSRRFSKFDTGFKRKISRAD